MTDDFHLFGDPDDGDRPIDPDLALISAYLARELSPMQVLALEERLATDAAFRAAMQPLIDAWAAPIASLEGGASRRTSPLSAAEQDEHWRRFQGESPTADSIRSISYRRGSMKRIAAVIAVTVIPMVSFAQVVLHAANNADVPGHTIAKRIVAPFVDEAASAKPRPAPARRPRPAQTAQSPAQATHRPVTVIPVITPESASARPAQRAQPDRAKIAELTRQHQPFVALGDTAAEYVVMVLDAADRYLWSTYGSGNLSLEIGGDTRTAAERSAYNREYRVEFRGAAAMSGGGGGRGGGAGGAAMTYDSAFMQLRLLETQRRQAAAGGARGGGAGGAVVLPRHDSVWISRTGDSVAVRGINGVVTGWKISVRGDTSGGFFSKFDSARAGARGGGGGGGRGGNASIVISDSGRLVHRQQLVELSGGYARGGGAGGRGGRGGTVDSVGAAQGTTYRSGFSGTMNGPLFNQARGLVAAGNGESGIEGLASASVSAAELYHYPAGELAPQPLKVMVVILTPGARWNGRF